ncbi:tail fiber assembly protein [Serratia sp. JSRIV001]|uniref:tail fiber assembly protein n=1 Tax=unclassified Serratia (in: enterobacteria) TaxID=2647522 RepID=UPI001CBE287D|nr:MULTISPECIES: tail fiber assembly protein [unclassified Serratia (in: enterobacteria)]UAN46993.1 tail fiber assembly protein [Serratia sp. JSRIV001]UAN57247.1 tail fiber assembly protein [Serratia sp. JSRIV004]
MFEMSGEAQTIKVYNFMADTKEFLGVSDCYIPAGTGLPAYCTVIEAPKAAEGCVVCFDNDEWQQKEDHRGRIVWEKSTRREMVIEKPGPIPDALTTLKPTSDYDVWDGKVWVKDEQVERNQIISNAEGKKRMLLAIATENINTLTDAVELEMATDEEKTQLIAWKKHRIELSRVDVNEAPNIDWPVI